MARFDEQIVRLWQEWEAETGQGSGDPDDFVDWAVANRKLVPRPQDVRKMLRRQVTQSLRQARRRDVEGGFTYRAFQSASLFESGEVIKHYFDTDTGGSPSLRQKSVRQRREAIANDVYRAVCDVDRMNRVHKDNPRTSSLTSPTMWLSNVGRKVRAEGGVVPVLFRARSSACDFATLFGAEFLGPRLSAVRPPRCCASTSDALPSASPVVTSKVSAWGHVTPVRKHSTMWRFSWTGVAVDPGLVLQRRQVEPLEQPRDLRSIASPERLCFCFCTATPARRPFRSPSSIAERSVPLTVGVPTREIDPRDHGAFPPAPRLHGPGGQTSTTGTQEMGAASSKSSGPAAPERRQAAPGRRRRPQLAEP